jgi:hypothetical protein
MQIADEKGLPTGKFRLTVESDEGGGGPYGNPKCFHDTEEEATICEDCDDYTSRAAGFPSKKTLKEQKEKEERRLLAILKEKYENPQENPQ